MFAGALNERIDMPLLSSLALALGDVPLTLLGPIQISLREIDHLSNVRIAPPVGPTALIRKLTRHRVGIIPFATNKMGQYCDPLKYFDYLCAGLEVVSTSIPSMVQDRRHCLVATSAVEFINHVLRALKSSPTPADIQDRNSFLRQNTWEVRTNALLERIRHHLAIKSHVPFRSK